MTRPTTFATQLVSLTLFTLVSFGSLAPALADMVKDTFPLKLTGKEWCRNDPKFFDMTKVKVTDGATLTLVRDVFNTNDLTDVLAIINTNGLNATIDAITLHGRALKANKSGAIAQLALSGRGFNNPDHFLTIRAQATFDKTGKLTKVTGTYVYQILSESGGVQDVDCFGSGTFGTQKLPPSGGGGGGGKLTVDNASASVNGKFVADANLTQVDTQGVVVWAELPVGIGNSQHTEFVEVRFDPFTGEVLLLTFSMMDGAVGTTWMCQPLPLIGCPGTSVNRTAGTFTLVNTALNILGGTNSPIRLNGTLNFTPF